jgi:hypothetical protein
VKKQLVVVLALLCACVGPRTFRFADAPQYAPTDPRSVQVFETMPEGAVVLGDVDGVGTTGLMVGPEALDSAKEGAAAMGADAIVVQARGTEPVVGDLFARDYQVVRVKAVRLRR